MGVDVVLARKSGSAYEDVNRIAGQSRFSG